MDIILSLFGLIALAPFFALIAILIKRDSSGPVFYHGLRAGRNGKDFKILKFRTMYDDNRSFAGPRVTAEDDPRITPLGKILRDSKINELPQLWNVLVGEMSMVGPRPEDPHIVAEWPESARKSILSVRPGVTSPASVMYRDEETLLQSKNLMDRYLGDILPSKLRLDQLYLRNRSIMTDLEVIFWTVVTMLPRLKTVTIPEHRLYWGPLSQFVDRYLTWFLVDVLVSFTSVAIAGVIWRASAPLDLGIQLATGIALAIALLFSVINYLMGLTRISWTQAKPSDLLDLAISSGLVTLVLFLLNLLGPQGPILPPSMLILAGLLSFFGFVAVRYRTHLANSLMDRMVRRGTIGNMGERVLIVGSGELSRFASWLLRNGGLPEAFNLVGYVDDDPRKVGMQIDGANVIGTTHDLQALCQEYDIGLILFAIANIAPVEADRILQACGECSARVVMVPDLLDALRAHFPSKESEPGELFGKVFRNSTTDRMTGAYNRQHFLKLAEFELPRARRYRHPLSIIMVKVHYKKPDNSVIMQPLDAKVLQAVVERIRASTREIDILARFDSVEFAILLPETDNLSAQRVAERIKQNIVAAPVTVDGSPIDLFVSSGVVTAREDTQDVDSLVNYARTSMASVRDAH
jgi:diguanylate cyclase (GGDEF)-like protein